MAKIQSIYQQARRHRAWISIMHNDVHINWLKQEIIGMRRDWYTISQIKDILIYQYGKMRGLSMSNIGKISKQAGISLYNGGEQSTGSGNFTRIRKKTNWWKF